MRTLIFSETPEAVRLCDALREAGENASLRARSPFRLNEIELCDKVICHVADSEIVAAYTSLGIGHQWLDNVQGDEPETAARPRGRRKAAGE